LKRIEMKESFVKSLLRNVFGILSVIRYSLCHGENSLLVTKNQFLESLRFSALCGSNHSAVGVFAYTDFAKRFHNPDLSRRFVTTRLALKKSNQFARPCVRTRQIASA
jgi:hypothetical protein